MGEDFRTIWTRFKDADILVEDKREQFGDKELYSLTFSLSNHPAIKRVQQALPSEGLERIDPAHFHITIKYLSFGARNRQGAIERFIEKCASAVEKTLPGRPIVATLGPVSRFPNVVFLEVHDRNELEKFHRELCAAIPAEFSFERDDYVPHIAIARFAGGDVEQTLRKLGELREQRGFDAVLDEVALVRSYYTDSGKVRKKLRRWHLSR